MHRASHNYGEARLLVLPAAGVDILSEENAVEVEVGSSLPLPVAFYGLHEGRKVYFTHCQKLPFDVTIGGN